MTPAPFTEAVLVVLGAIIGAALLSYLLHSTLLIGAAAVFTRVRTMAAVDRARLWRFVVVAPFATAAIQVSGVSGAALLSVDMAALLPQGLVDWRLGIVGASLVLLALVTAVVAWIAGAFAVRRLLGLRRAAPARVQQEADAIAAIAGCAPPRVTVSDGTLVPAAVGSSEVIVPAGAVETWTPEERRSLLAHEIGHLMARDPLWFSIVSALARVAVFQPLNRFAVAQLRIASEEAADDFAAIATGDRYSLARALAGLASMLLLLPGGVAATGSPIVTRVTRLLADDRPPVPWRVSTRRLGALVVLAAMALGAPGVTASPNAVANRLAWLSPGRDQPNRRMIAVRHVQREIREQLRVPSASFSH